MLVGYARGSTAEQSLALQQDALTAAGCGRTFSDIVSGAAENRAGLAAALDYVRAGDTLVVWRLDRLGRTLRHLIARVTALDAVGVGFHSSTEAIDTTTTGGGKLVFRSFGALAEFERELIRERTRAGLAAARARRGMGGRPRVLTDAQMEMARVLLDDPLRPIDDVCAALTCRARYCTGTCPAEAGRPARCCPSARRSAGVGPRVRRNRLISPSSGARRTGLRPVPELDLPRKPRPVLTHDILRGA